MTRSVALLLGIVIGVLLGAACVVVGFNLGRVTAAVPSRPAPVVFAPLPRLPPGPSVGLANQPAGARPAWRVAGDAPDAGQGDPPVRVSPAPEPTEPSVTPIPAGMGGAASLVTGLATWYSVGPGVYGAAGPLLRVGDWRGRMVEVCVKGHARCLRLRLVDHCACGDRPGGPTLLDLSRDAFARLAPPSRGLVEVTVSW